MRAGAPAFTPAVTALAVLAGVAVAGVTYFYFQSSNHFFEGERASIPGNGKGSGARIEGVVSDQFCS